MTTKIPLVLWSGGFDSTALVIDLLHNSDIDIMYVNLENNEKQQRHEKRAIAKLKVIIADANLKGKILNEHVFGYNEIHATKSIYAQPSLWINAATFIANPQRHDSVQIAYVKYDDVWHYKTEVKNAYTAMNNLLCEGEDFVPLKFPYEWCTKAGILDILEDFVYCKQVMNTIRYCEMRDKEPCGECGSCKRHAKELDLEDKAPVFMAIDMTDELKKFEAEQAEAKEKEHE